MDAGKLSQRRRSTGNIKSPIVKRDSRSEVILKGWLFKLEGSTLKQWKKRWCVLADFCLFYYKNPEEERFLGSILLPSYKINPCTSDDKVSRKFAFKAEHQNMKTYYFAADSKSSMCQWMNAMCLSSIMQRDTSLDPPVVSRPSGGYFSRHEDEDSGFTSYRSRRYVGGSDPNSTLNSSFASEQFMLQNQSSLRECERLIAENGYLGSGDKYPSSYSESPVSIQHGSGDMKYYPRSQPVYANAPPKPKRLDHVDPYAIPPGVQYDTSFATPELISDHSHYLYPQGRTLSPGFIEVPQDLPRHHSPQSRRKHEPDYEYQNMPIMRPRSVDFLARDYWDGPDVCPQYSEKRTPKQQVPRPKSSIERYDPSMYMDDDLMTRSCGPLDMMDYGDESMHPQGGMWSGKMYHHMSQHGAPANNASYFNSESRLSMGRSSLGNLGTKRQNQPSRSTPTGLPSSDQKEESMKRLLEWKQRMLQSPLRKKQVPTSSPSVVSTPALQKEPPVGLGLGLDDTIPPERPPLPEEYRRKVLEDLENHEATLRLHETRTPKHKKHQERPKSELIMYSDRGPVPQKHQDQWKSPYPAEYVSSEDEKLKPRPSSALPTSGNALLDRRNTPSRQQLMMPPVESSPDYVNLRKLRPPDLCREKPEGQVADPETPTLKSFRNHSNFVPRMEHERPQSTFERDPGIRREPAGQEADDDDDILLDKFIMRREDYFRASQKLYSKYPSGKFHREKSSKPGSISGDLPSSEVDTSIDTETFDSRYRRNLKTPTSFEWELDKDVGLPVPENTDTLRSLTSPKPSSEGYGSHLPGDQSPEFFRGSLKPSRTYVREKSTSSKTSLEHGEKSDESQIETTESSPPKKAENLFQFNEIQSAPSESDMNKKLNYSYEEMRSLLQHKKEAPPANIVQERIKHFESKEELNPLKDTKPQMVMKIKDFLTKDFAPSNSGLIWPRDEISSIWDTPPVRQRRHSDSEAVRTADNSEGESNDDIITTKSAPVILSPLSSVLADLRKTADTRKERSGRKQTVTSVDDVIITPGAMRLGMKEASEVTVKGSKCQDPTLDLGKPEEHYLPMGGKMCRESEYVAMDTDDVPNYSLPAPNEGEEEPVYNEPLTPVPSFVHDGFNRQKMRRSPARRYTSSCSDSSSDESSENVYERLRHKPKPDSSRKLPSTEEETKGNENKELLYEEPYEVINVSQKTSPGERREVRTSDQSFGRKFPLSKPSGRTFEDSIPDLLHHEEVKDSSASDADDEASRDFDSCQSSVPNYQKAVLGENMDMLQNTSGRKSKTSLPLSPLSIQTYSPVYAHASKYISSGAKEYDTSSKSIKESPPKDSFSSYHLYEDDRRKTEILYKHTDSSDSSKQSPGKANPLKIKKLRIYTEGTTAENSADLYKNDLKSDHLREFHNDSSQSAEQSGESLSPITSHFSNSANYFPDRIEQEQSLQIGNNNASFKSAAPDVVPSEVKSDTTQPKRSSNKAPSPSAPYYYSDLLSEQGLASSKEGAFDKGHFSKQISCSTSRSMPALLNNIREVGSSPLNNKNDVGRKVNKISTCSPEACMDGMSSLQSNNSLSPEPDPTSPEFRNSLQRLLLQPESKKFLDAERNKYEAGHTLDKTSQMSLSMFAHLRKRASTPDFDSPRPSDASLEEEMFRPSILPKRLSRSLEGHLDVAAADNDDSRSESTSPNAREEPFYENIAFAHNRKVRYEKYTGCSTASPQVSPAKHSVYEGEVLCDFLLASHIEKKPEEQSTGGLLEGNFLQSALKDSNSDHCQDQEDSGIFSNIGSHYFLGERNRSDFDGGGMQTSFPDHEDSHLRDEAETEIKQPYSPPKGRMEKEYSETSYTSSYISKSENSLSTKASKKQKSWYSKEDLNLSDSEVEVNKPSKLKQDVECLTDQSKRRSISAGDLLGKTHEELVLLLIQLRRNQTKMTCLKDQCRGELEAKTQLLDQFYMDHGSNDPQLLDTTKKLQQKLEEFTKNLELTQPLINLVDNMVKLGSLYRGTQPQSSVPKWNRSRPEGLWSLTQLDQLGSSSDDQLSDSKLDCTQQNLKEQLGRLYSLDRTLHDESSNLLALQQDKEMLEKTLEGVRMKIQNSTDDPVGSEKLKKQLRMIEKEMVSVKNLLAHSASKVKEAAAENAVCEREVISLGQKMQHALRSSPPKKMSDPSTAELEAELSRVQSVIEELAIRRQEISAAVDFIKSESQSKMKLAEIRSSPTGLAGSAALPGRKKHQKTYYETDLDANVTQDLAYSQLQNAMAGKSLDLYDSPEPSGEQFGAFEDDMLENDMYAPQDINEADDRMKRFYGIIPRDKPQEIKTVRIVKRESERRHRGRDRKKVSYDENSLVWVVEEPEWMFYDEQADTAVGQHNSQLPGHQGRPTSLLHSSEDVKFSSMSSTPSSPEQLSLAWNQCGLRRNKRRHYTISGSQPFLEQLSPPKLIPGLRSRDDMDMERCLRTVNTPDIVRSTIKKSEVYDEHLIDRELSLPQKIVIPERYIEDEPENLSAAEQLRRSLKAANIRRMLTESVAYQDLGIEPSETLKKKVDEEKRRRAHLLALNHTLAKEVMERSKIVAAHVSSTDHAYNN